MKIDCRLLKHTDDVSQRVNHIGLLPNISQHILFYDVMHVWNLRQNYHWNNVLIIAEVNDTGWTRSNIKKKTRSVSLQLLHPHINASVWAHSAPVGTKVSLLWSLTDPINYRYTSHLEDMWEAVGCFWIFIHNIRNTVYWEIYSTNSISIAAELL